MAQAVYNGNDNNKKVAFKNAAPFTVCISGINSTQKDNAKYIDLITPMYNLIVYSNNHSKTLGGFLE